MEWIIFNHEQIETLSDLNDKTEFKVKPRRIDNPESPKFDMCASTLSVIRGEYTEYWAPLLADYERIVAHPDELFIPQE